MRNANGQRHLGGDARSSPAFCTSLGGGELQKAFQQNSDRPTETQGCLLDFMGHHRMQYNTAEE